MPFQKTFFRPFIFLIICFLLTTSGAFAQKKNKNDYLKNTAIMWEPVNIGQRNLYLGPGGVEMQPDIRKITLLKEEKGGHSKKFRIKDALGREWVAKVGNEAQSETAAVRLIWALGYKTEINYLVPKLTIPGKGVFTNVRLEARPSNLDRKKNWSWDKNPFSNKDEFQGLKIMMAFLNNWDLKTVNNVILANDDADENYYVVSDLGVSFGRLGSNSLPIFWRIGRSRNNPLHYNQSKFIKGTKKERLRLVYNGKSSGIFDDITVEDGRWLANLLLQLSDKQIRDAFRAANYSSSDINLLTQTVRKRITELDRVTKGQMAEK